MRFSYFDDKRVSTAAVEKAVTAVAAYRRSIKKVVTHNDVTKPEYSLVAAQDQKLHKTLDDIEKKFTNLKQVVVIGIGGSSLGLEAVHAALATSKVQLHTLDTVSVSEMECVIRALKKVKNYKSIGVCVVSKSGSTAETLTNADVLLNALEEKWGKKIYTQVVCIGDSGTAFQKAYKRKGVTTIAMPGIVGGRFSVATAVGLVPMKMLGHDTDAFIGGLTDANAESFEEVAAESAARISIYMDKKYAHYNFFAFETRLEKLGEWYRQLFAESLGKAKDKKKQPVQGGMLPTISTPVELHSVGQLYLSGFDGVYTDFVTFDDMEYDYDISGAAPTTAYKGKTLQEVATAIYGGVVGAYRENNLPYRSTIFTEDLTYSLGLFMGMRMREVMYVAKLRNLNAFDQPNVESYKKITREILGL